MDRREALLFLDKCRQWFEPYTGVPEKWHEALDLAIEALKEPTGDYEFFGGTYAKESDAESATTTDCISRADAIEAVDKYYNPSMYAFDTNKIKADIESLPSFTPKVSEDCISRQQAVEALTGWDTDPSDEDIVRQLNALPQVTPTERTGEWVFRTDIPISGGGSSAGYICSNCGEDYFKVDRYHYCPNCGAKMVDGGDV